MSDKCYIPVEVFVFNLNFLVMYKMHVKSVVSSVLSGVSANGPINQNVVKK